MVRRCRWLGVGVALVACGCRSFTGGTVPELTEAQKEAIEAAASALANAASTLAAMAPPADASASMDGDGSFGDCPVVDVGVDGAAITLTLDYGEGCEPAVYPGATLSGSMSGTIDLSAGSVSLTLNTLTIDGESVDGSLSAAVSRSGSTASLSADVDLTFGDGTSIDGQLTAEWNRDTGGVVITTASLTIGTADGGTVAVTFADITVDYGTYGNFLPAAGTATFEMPTTAPGSGTVTITVEFTEETPATGVVLVSVDGSAQVEYTLSGG